MTANTVIRVHQYGGPECLTLDDLPLEPLQPDQLLIGVQAAGINFFDTQLRSGLYKQPLPMPWATRAPASSARLVPA
jgi:NADPH2:quinone reductase